MDDGVISGNTAAGGNGGGVSVSGGGSEFNLNGGVIRSNTASINGGGVSLTGGIAVGFTMSGGMIYGTDNAQKNTASGLGAALYNVDTTAAWDGGITNGHIGGTSYSPGAAIFTADETLSTTP
jgi:hypothetical protein